MNKEIIEALLEGKTIQFENKCDSPTNKEGDNYWIDLDPSHPNFHPAKNPRLYADLFVDDSAYKWRIKPEYKDVTCKSALMDNGYVMYVCINGEYC